MMHGDKRKIKPRIAPMYADKVKKAFFAASKARKRDGESASRRDFNVVFQRSLSAPSLRFGTKLWATQNVAPKRGVFR